MRADGRGYISYELDTHHFRILFFILWPYRDRVSVLSAAKFKLRARHLAPTDQGSMHIVNTTQKCALPESYCRATENTHRFVLTPITRVVST